MKERREHHWDKESRKKIKIKQTARKEAFNIETQVHIKKKKKVSHRQNEKTTFFPHSK